jgi:hypothetical protein
VPSCKLQILGVRDVLKRAGRIGALRLTQALGSTGLLDRKAPSLLECSTQFLAWVTTAALASKTKKYYANGWRLLSSTKLVRMRLDATDEEIEACEMNPDPDDLESSLLREIEQTTGVHGQTIVAFC